MKQLAMRCFNHSNNHRPVRLLLFLSPSILYASSSSAFLLLLPAKSKHHHYRRLHYQRNIIAPITTTSSYLSLDFFPSHSTRIVSSSLPAVAGDGTTSSSSSLMDERKSCSSSNDEQQNQKQRQRQGQGQGQQQNIKDTKLIANDEELARQRRIGQMNQRVQKAVSAEDRIYVLEAKAKLAKQQQQTMSMPLSKSSSSVSENVVTVGDATDNNNNATTDMMMMMTKAEYAELNGLLKVRGIFEEQYDPNKFTKEHVEFKDMHNDAFIQLARYCERERNKIRINRNNDIEQQQQQQQQQSSSSSSSSQSPPQLPITTTTNLFFLDGPDGGTTSALLKRGKFKSNQCYVANRHAASCDLLRKSGGGLLPDENVVHATSSEAFTSQGTTTSTTTDSFAHIDFTAYYFDGCGGYVPHVIDMLSSALLSQQHQQEENDDNDDDDNDHNYGNNTDSMNSSGPIAVGYSLLGGSKNVIKKELTISRALTIIARKRGMRMIHVLDDPIRYGLTPSIQKIGGIGDSGGSSKLSNSGGNTFTTWLLLQPE
jgi:hypothetical protein